MKSATSTASILSLVLALPFVSLASSEMPAKPIVGEAQEESLFYEDDAFHVDTRISIDGVWGDDVGAAGDRSFQLSEFDIRFSKTWMDWLTTVVTLRLDSISDNSDFDVDLDSSVIRNAFVHIDLENLSDGLGGFEVRLLKHKAALASDVEKRPIRKNSPVYEYVDRLTSERMGISVTLTPSEMKEGVSESLRATVSYFNSVQNDSDLDFDSVSGLLEGSLGGVDFSLGAADIENTGQYLTASAEFGVTEDLEVAAALVEELEDEAGGKEDRVISVSGSYAGVGPGTLLAQVSRVEGDEEENSAGAWYQVQTSVGTFSVGLNHIDPETGDSDTRIETSYDLGGAWSTGGNGIQPLSAKQTDALGDE